uniref:CCHC-type domain-containing protein n=1 Tax=Anopheles atroparvus TaxID=41427 RepID=A0A182JIB7_ANOAO
MSANAKSRKVKEKEKSNRSTPSESDSSDSTESKRSKMDATSTTNSEEEMSTEDSSTETETSANDGFTELYLVHFKRGSCTLASLQAIRSIQSVIVRWEPYRGGRKGPTQCLRCQDFGHGTRHCRLQPRCANCAGNHLTNDCSANTEEVNKCANCQGNHRANNVECPQRAKYQEQVTSSSSTPANGSTPGTRPNRVATRNQ